MNFRNYIFLSLFLSLFINCNANASDFSKDGKTYFKEDSFLIDELDTEGNYKRDKLLNFGFQTDKDKKNLYIMFYGNSLIDLFIITLDDVAVDSLYEELNVILNDPRYINCSYSFKTYTNSNKEKLQIISNEYYHNLKENELMLILFIKGFNVVKKTYEEKIFLIEAKKFKGVLVQSINNRKNEKVD